MSIMHAFFKEYILLDYSTDSVSSKKTQNILSNRN